MSWAKVRNLASGTGIATDLSIALTPGTPSLAGSQVFVVVAHDVQIGTSVAVSDANNGSYALTHQDLITGKALQIFAKTCPSATGIITISGFLAGLKIVGCYEYSGGSVTECGENDGAGGSGTPNVSVNISADNSLCIAASIELITPNDINPMAGWTQDENINHATVGFSLNVQHVIGLAQGSNSFAPGTSLAGGSWTCILDAFQQQALGGMENFLPCIGVG